MTRVKIPAVAYDQVDLMLHLVDILNVMDRPQKPLVLGLQSDQRRRKSRILPVHRLLAFPASSPRWEGKGEYHAAQRTCH